MARAEALPGEAVRDVRETHRSLAGLLARHPADAACPAAVWCFAVGARRVLEDLRIAAVSPTPSPPVAEDWGERWWRRGILTTWLWRRSLDRELAGEGPLLQPPVAAARDALTGWAADYLEFLERFPPERLRATRRAATGLGYPNVFEWARLLRVYARDVESRLAVGERKKE